MKIEDLEPLIVAGLIRVSNPDVIRDLIKHHGNKKIAREGGNIRATMNNNREILIEGTITAQLQSGAK